MWFFDCLPIRVKHGLKSKLSEPATGSQLAQYMSKWGIVRQAAVAEEQIWVTLTTTRAKEVSKAYCHVSRRVLPPEVFRQTTIL